MKMKLISLMLSVLVCFECHAASPLRTFPIPQSLRTPAANREIDMNDVISSFDYATAAFGGTNLAFTNFMALATTQTVTGPKVFSGVNVYSNVTQIFAGGKADNVLMTNIPSAMMATGYVGIAYITTNLVITNTAPLITAKDSNAGVDAKETHLNFNNGGFSVEFYDGSGSHSDTPFNITRSGASADTISMNAPVLFNYTGAFNLGMTADSVGATVVGAAIANLTNVNVSGEFAVSNAAPFIRIYNTAGTADDKIWKWRSSGDNLLLSTYNDAGTLVDNAINITRVAGSITGISFSGAISSSGFSSSGEIISDTDIFANGILGGGSSSPTIPASMTGGILSSDSTGPSADPITGAVLWSDGAGWKYRTSVASEGSGGDNRIHNRESTVPGAGTDYNLTASTAAIDFGTTDPVVVMPTAGKYLIQADIRFTNGATATDAYAFKLRNTTTSTDLVSDWVGSCTAVSQIVQITIQGTMTCAASDSITIFGNNNSAAVRGAVNSAGTRIRYIRLH